MTDRKQKTRLGSISRKTDASQSGNAASSRRRMEILDEIEEKYDQKDYLDKSGP